MKKYIGTKMVSATPAIRKGGKVYLPTDEIPKSMEPVEEGYKVVYEDGYESWSPKDVFEKAYKVAETPLDRVNIECAEVRERCDKLGQFIHNQNDGKDYQALPLGIRAMLLAQLHAMCAYSNLLDLRQSCMEGNEECRPWGLSFEQILPLLREGFAIRRNGWNGKGLMVFKQVPAHIDGTIIPNMQSLPQSAKDQIMKHTGFIDYTSQCLIYNSQTGQADSWVPSISDVFANDWEVVTE